MAKQITRTIRITYKDTQEGHAQRDRLVSEIVNRLKVGSEQEGLFAIFEDGLTHYLEKLSQNESNLWLSQQLAIRQKLAELREREQVLIELDTLWQTLPAKEFEKWCQEKKIDFGKFLEWKEAKTSRNESEKERDWLKNFLKEGEPIPTSVIRQMAIEEGIIDGTETAWNHLRATAVRQGYTGGKWGHWQNGAYAGEF